MMARPWARPSLHQSSLRLYRAAPQSYESHQARQPSFVGVPQPPNRRRRLQAPWASHSPSCLHGECLGAPGRPPALLAALIERAADLRPAACTPPAARRLFSKKEMRILMVKSETAPGAAQRSGGQAPALKRGLWALTLPGPPLRR